MNNYRFPYSRRRERSLPSGYGSKTLGTEGMAQTTNGPKNLDVSTSPSIEVEAMIPFVMPSLT